MQSKRTQVLWYGLLIKGQGLEKGKVGLRMDSTKGATSRDLTYINAQTILRTLRPTLIMQLETMLNCITIHIP